MTCPRPRPCSLRRVPTGILLLILVWHSCEADEAANPFTGTPLSIERMRWSLEQARLDEQLQASLLNRRKFELERQRLDDRPLPLTALPSQVHGLPAAAIAAPPGEGPSGTGMLRAAPPASLPAPVEPLRRRRPSRAAAPQSSTAGGAPALRILGVRSQGARWCVLGLEQERLWTLCPGDWHRGHHLDAADAGSYTVDGVRHVLEAPAPRLAVALPSPARGQAATEPPLPDAVEDSAGPLHLPGDDPGWSLDAPGGASGRVSGMLAPLAAPARAAQP